MSLGRLRIGMMMVWLGGVCGACGGEEEVSLELMEVGQAPGGALDGLELVEIGGEELWVAAAGDRVFIRGPEDGSWEMRPAVWPTRVEETGLDVLGVARQNGTAGDFVTRRYFVAHEEELFTVGVPSARAPVVLMGSDDAGLSWRELGPPEEEMEQRAVQSGEPSLMPAVRYIRAGGELFLVDGLRVWRRVPEVEREEEGRGWEPVDLSGLGLIEEEGERRRMLPRRLRHYLPSEEGKEYEVATVYGEELEVFRREEGQERFRHVATLDLLDRDLQRAPSEEGELYLLTREGLWKSGDRGEGWERLEIRQEGLEEEGLNDLVFLEGAAWLSSDRGSLWESVDGGESWTRRRSGDADGRAVTALGVRGRSLWATTAGSGALRSPDGGRSWEESNEGVDNAHTYAVWSGEEGDLLVGTNSGLFSWSREGGGVRWQRVHPRATTAIKVLEGKVLSGTLGGSVLVQEEGETHEVAALGRRGEVSYQPPQMEPEGLRAASIVGFQRREGTSDLVAWSYQQGPLISNDEGRSFRPMQLGGAFRGAVQRAVLTHFLAAQDMTLLAVTRPMTANQPAQIWKSSDEGETWQAMYSAMEEEVPARMSLVELGEILVMAQGNRLARSEDQGETWTTLVGPWEQGRVVGLGVDRGRVVVAVNLGPGTELLWVEDPGGDLSVGMRKRLATSSGWLTLKEGAVSLSSNRERVVVQQGAVVFEAEAPRRQVGGGSGGVAWLVSLLVVIALSGVAFAVLRRDG